jgi:hypothetical protein
MRIIICIKFLLFKKYYISIIKNDLLYRVNQHIFYFNNEDIKIK